MYQVQIGFSMTSSEDVKVLFGMHSMFSTNFGSGNGGDGDASVLDRDWNHRKSQFVKVYIDFDFHGYWL
jgi:hypothetical protein